MIIRVISTHYYILYDNPGRRDRHVGLRLQHDPRQPPSHPRHVARRGAAAHALQDIIRGSILNNDDNNDNNDEHTNNTDNGINTTTSEYFNW